LTGNLNCILSLTAITVSSEIALPQTRSNRQKISRPVNQCLFAGVSYNLRLCIKLVVYGLTGRQLTPAPDLNPNLRSSLRRYSRNLPTPNDLHSCPHLYFGVHNFGKSLHSNPSLCWSQGVFSPTRADHQTCPRVLSVRESFRHGRKHCRPQPSPTGAVSTHCAEGAGVDPPTRQDAVPSHPQPSPTGAVSTQPPVYYLSGNREEYLLAPALSHRR